MWGAENDSRENFENKSFFFPSREEVDPRSAFAYISLYLQHFSNEDSNPPPPNHVRVVVAVVRGKAAPFERGDVCVIL